VRAVSAQTTQKCWGQNRRVFVVFGARLVFLGLSYLNLFSKASDPVSLVTHAKIIKLPTQCIVTNASGWVISTEMMLSPTTAFSSSVGISYT
jgi:hypothetical protein